MQVKFKYILADSWFCSKDNMNFIHHTLSKKFILGMKSNRVVALSDYARKNKSFIKLSELDIADGESLKIWLKKQNIDDALIQPYSGHEKKRFFRKIF